MTAAQITALNTLDAGRMGRAVQEFIDSQPDRRTELMKAIREHAPSAWDAWLSQACVRR